MKSNSTMLAEARNLAFRKEQTEITTPDGITVVGYCLTISELRKLYFENGFLEKTMRRHLSTWKEIDVVRTYQYDAMIFFIPRCQDKQYNILKRIRETRLDVHVDLPEATA